MSTPTHRGSSVVPQDIAFALPSGIELHVRPLRPSDADAVVALARDDEVETLPEPMTELVDVQRTWRQPSTDLTWSGYRSQCPHLGDGDRPARW